MIDNLPFRIIRDLKPGSVFLVEDSRGERFVIKKSPAASRVVKFSRLVHQKGGELGEVMPVFWAKGKFLWQKFLPWSLAGDTVESYGIKSETFAFVDPEKLGRAIAELQSFPFSDPTMDTRMADFYLKNTSEFREALTQEFNPDFADKVEQFLRSQSSLVDKYSHFLANGDLHPQNIMYPPSPRLRRASQFMLVDWDLLHLNNPGWDLTDLYVWGWRDSSWQDRLLDTYKKVMPTPKSIFEKIFAFDVVYLTSQLIKHAKLIKAPKEFMDAQKKILLTHLESHSE
ncbi:phosphotransferase [Candidatus Gottesmanbacteria bacterium]|nr:phosphotransferase [Candidatus Gottesmanbacteria bacterium]